MLRSSFASPTSILHRANRRASKASLAIPQIGALARVLNGPEAERLETVRHLIALPRLPASFAGMKIAHLSDFHFEPLLGEVQPRVAVERAMDQHPDLIAITGDFVSRLDSEVAGLLARTLSRLRAPLGVYAILGNHDHWVDDEAVEALLRTVGVTVLRNDSVALAREGQRLHLAGVDDVNSQRHDLAGALRSVPADEPAILLAHEPDYADEAAADPRVVLQLSGHSHGGQVCLPIIGPVFLPNNGRKYRQGEHRVGDLRLYTTRGVGACYPPIRVNCRPELAVIELTGSPAA